MNDDEDDFDPDPWYEEMARYYDEWAASGEPERPT